MELFPHQRVGVEYLQTKRYAILGDTMGLGKTITALTAAENRRTLIVCPAFLKQVWALELESYFPSRKVNIPSSKNTPKTISENESVIVNYELLEKVTHLFKHAEVVIADEAHYLKNGKAKRTKAFVKSVASAKPDFCWLLSGTPIKNKVPEIYVLLRICGLNPAETNGKRIQSEFRSMTSFSEMFCNSRIIRRGGMRLQEYYGIRNVPLLRRYLSDKYLARKLEDVMTLPDLTEQILPVATIGARDLDLSAAFENYQTGRSTEAPLKVQTAIEKVQFTIEVIRGFLREDRSPIIVFTDHREPARLLHETLSNECLTARIDGGVPIGARAKIVKDFQSGLIDVLVCTVGAAGVGLTLTASNTMVFNDYPWVPGDLNQAMKRFHRIGQRRPCRCYFITAPGIDSVIARTLASKTQVISEALE